MPNSFQYFENWRTTQFTCSSCNWQGLGSDLKIGEVTGMYFELECPECRTYITVVGHPTIEESRANWDKLSKTEQEELVKKEVRVR